VVIQVLEGDMRRSMTTVVVLAIMFSTVMIHAQGNSDNASSNSANNPVEPRLTVEYWNYYAPSLNDLDGGSENGIARSLFPFKIDGIQQVMHVDPTVVTNPVARSGPRTGLGGIQLYNFTLEPFDLGLPEKVTFGLGPVFVTPTRTSRNFNSDKWQAGAGGVIIAPQEWGLLGVLVTNQNTVSGPSSHLTSILPQIFYNLPHGYYLRSSGTVSFDTANQTKVVPVGFGFGRVINLDGGYTLNLYVEGQPSLYRTGFGAPNYQVFTGIALQLPATFTRGWDIL
jgi:hypothetical protein